MKTRLLGLLGLALAAASPAFADSPFTLVQGANDVAPTASPPFAHWDLRAFTDCKVPYAFGNLTVDVPAATATGQVDMAFQTWENVSPAIIRFVDTGNVAAGSASDGQNVVFWDNSLCSGDPWDAGLRGGSIGITAVRHNAATGILTDVDIVFDDAHFDWNNGTQNAPALTGGDDFAAVQTLGDGSRREVIATGANGICETKAVCGDVQVAAVGANIGANKVCVAPAAAAVLPPAAPTPLAGTVANLSGQMDIWTIAEHEIGHFCGMGENNGPGATSSSIEGFNNEPFLVPGGANLTFTIGGLPVNVNLTAGFARSAANIAVEINAAIAAQQPGKGNATASSTGSIQITATNAANAVVITGGTVTGVLGLPLESGISTMNQTDPRGLTSLDQRTPSRHDVNGLNFLYTPDLGDAREFAAGMYQTKVHTATPAGMLNGQQLFQPGPGPVHLFGYPPYRFEWLGAKVDGNPNECEALTSNADPFDDGFSLPDSLLAPGFTSHVKVRVSTFNPAGAPARYVLGVNSLMLHVNGYFDLNRNHEFDPGERLIHWSGVPGSTDAASGNFKPGESDLAANPMVLAFDLAVPDTSNPDSIYARIRLDWGENEGRAAGGNVNGDLAPAVGGAQFGEVEDYSVKIEDAGELACGDSSEVAPDDTASVYWDLVNTGSAPRTYHYRIFDTASWTITNHTGLALDDTLTLPPSDGFGINLGVTPPPDCYDGDVDTVCMVVQVGDSTGPSDTCCVPVVCRLPVPVAVTSFQGLAGADGVTLSFEVTPDPTLAGVNVYRGPAGGQVLRRLTQSPLHAQRTGPYTFHDADVEPGGTYHYELGLVRTDGSETRAGSVIVSMRPVPFALGPPVPNPAASGVSFEASLPAPAAASLRIYDVSGRLVRNLFQGDLPAGRQTLAWNGRADNGETAASGIYFAEFRAGNQRATRRVLIQH